MKTRFILISTTVKADVVYWENYENRYTINRNKLLTYKKFGVEKPNKVTNPITPTIVHHTESDY